jgi:hypothetical protein
MPKTAARRARERADRERAAAYDPTRPTPRQLADKRARAARRAAAEGDPPTLPPAVGGPRPEPTNARPGGPCERGATVRRSVNAGLEPAGPRLVGVEPLRPPRRGVVVPRPATDPS